MTTLRRFAYAVFGVACTHLVFGAIVRISGSGMGCGPHWPDCEGHLIPPMNRPDLIIEVTHRYLASILLLSLIALSTTAFRRRAEPGVGGRGGVLRMALLATELGFGAAILGAVTVKYGNAPLATVAHWTVAMSLVAAVTATVIRAGGLGGASARLGGASSKTRRGTFAAAALALVAVVMGGLTAKVQGGPIACLAFPLCGANPAVPRGAVHVQSGHRVIAVLLVLHLVGLFFALRKRGEVPVVRRALSVALGLGVLQLLIAGAMIGMHLPPALRSLHEATGVSIWIACFALAYLSRLASDDRATGSVRGAPAGPVTPRDPTDPVEPIDAGPLAAASLRTSVAARPVLASSTRPRAESVAPMDAPERSARRTPAAVPTVEAPRLAVAYLPPAGEATGDACVADAVPEPAEAPRRQPDQRLELPAAVARARRVALEAALAFARDAARMTIAAGASIVAEQATVAEPATVGEPAMVAEPGSVDEVRNVGWGAPL